MKILPIFLASVLLAIIGFNEFYLKSEIKRLEKEKLIAKHRLEISFFKDNLNLNLNKPNVPILSTDTANYNYFIRIENTLCVSCVEQLLKILDNANIDDITKIYTSTDHQLDYILGLNDKFSLSFSVETISDSLNYEAEKIFFYTIKKHYVNSILEYQLKNDQYFKERVEKFIQK